jgi:hypothetical protein
MKGILSFFLWKTAQNEARKRSFAEQMSESLLCALEVHSKLEDPSFEERKGNQFSVGQSVFCSNVQCSPSSTLLQINSQNPVKCCVTGVANKKRDYERSFCSRPLVIKMYIYRMFHSLPNPAFL